MKMEFSYEMSNLSDEEFIRLNEIDNNRLLYWYDTSVKYEELKDFLSIITINTNICYKLEQIVFEYSINDDIAEIKNHLEEIEEQLQYAIDNY